METIVLTSSLPRSGSTLLQNLLAQSPNHHCTGTNDLIDTLMKVRDSWMMSPGFVAQGLKTIEPRIIKLMRGMVKGFYEQEFTEGKAVFDKSRGWLTYLEMMERIMGRPVKAVVTVRDIRDVIASFERIYRKSSITDHPVAGMEVFRRLTVQGRAERLLSIEHTVGYMIHCLYDVFQRGLDNRLVIVPYRELTCDPVGTIQRVCQECGLPPFACDPSNVKQIIHEDDTVYGMYDLHTIRPKVEPAQERTWEGILPEVFADYLNKEYSFVQELANKRYLSKNNTSDFLSIPMTSLTVPRR
jgi:sulfotransferase